MPIFGVPNNKKPKNVNEGLGLENSGAIVPTVKVPDMTGGAMGSLTEMAMERKKMNGELGGPSQMNQQALFNKKKQKKMNNGMNTGFTPGEVM